MDQLERRVSDASSLSHDWRDSELIRWRWDAFEWLFGCVLPIVCFVLERRLLDGRMFAGQTRLVVYPFVASEIALLAWWKAWPARSEFASLFVAGALGIGACVAAVIGVVLAPLSVVAAIFGIGFLGLVPLGTAVGFARVCQRTYRYAAPGPWILAHAPFALGAIASCTPSAIAVGVEAWAVDSSLARLERGDARCVDDAIARLRALPWFDEDRLVNAYESTNDAAVRERIDSVYRGLTRGSIEERLADLND